MSVCWSAIFYLNAIVLLYRHVVNTLNAFIAIQRGGGDGPSPPLFGHFVKDFTKTLHFYQYSPLLSVSPPPFRVSLYAPVCINVCKIRVLKYTDSIFLFMIFIFLAKTLTNTNF